MTYVDNCHECQDEECAREEHAPVNLPTKCDICPDAPVRFAGDCLGNVLAACKSHDRYLDGWVRDTLSEVNAETRAAARFEDMAYGYDD